MIDVPYEVQELTLEITLEDPSATYEVIGNENFVVGANNVQITVTDANGDQTTYHLTVMRQPSVNNYLMDIVVSEGTLTPAFTKETSNYEVLVPSHVNTIDVTGILEDVSASLDGNGTYSLTPGDNYVYLNVTSMEGYVRTYTVKIIREMGANNKLLTLSVVPGQMDKIFDPDVFSYTVNVDEGTEEVEITATADPTATITGT